MLALAVADPATTGFLFWGRAHCRQKSASVLHCVGPPSDAVLNGASVLSLLPHREAIVRNARCVDNPFHVRRRVMLYYAAVFFIIAIVAGLLGFGGVAAGASSIAQVLFFIFLVLFLVSLVGGLMKRSK